MAKREKGAAVTIKPPNFRTAEFKITGTAQLVVHRFSAKTKIEMKQKMETGKAALVKAQGQIGQQPADRGGPADHRWGQQAEHDGVYREHTVEGHREGMARNPARQRPAGMRKARV